eukprot:s5088_g3.t2
MLCCFWIATLALEAASMSCRLDLSATARAASAGVLVFPDICAAHLLGQSNPFLLHESLTNSEQGMWQKRCAPWVRNANSMTEPLGNFRAWAESEDRPKHDSLCLKGRTTEMTLSHQTVSCGAAKDQLLLEFLAQSAPAPGLRHWAGSGGGLGRRWSPVTPSLFCVVGVVLGDIPRLGGAWSHLRAFRVAGAGLTALGWLWWRPWSPLVAGDAPLRGRRRSAWRHPRAFPVACVDRRVPFVWQVWHLRRWAGSGGGLGRRWSPVTRLFCVARVALGDICLRFVWQAWRLATSIFTGSDR